MIKTEFKGSYLLGESLLHEVINSLYVSSCILTEDYKKRTGKERDPFDTVPGALTLKLCRVAGYTDFKEFKECTEFKQDDV